MFWPNLDSERVSPSTSSTDFKNVTRHQSILTNEVLSLLACRSGRTYLDLTVGGGGHSEALLHATAPHGRVVGVDRDAQALKISGQRLRPFGARIKLLYGSLGKVSEILSQADLAEVHGVLIDCGISSDQLDDAARGFSFQREGPLDMRMDPTRGISAAEWLAQSSERELADAIYRFGEERLSRRIAKAVVTARRSQKLQTTLDLAEIVAEVYPKKARSKRIHPATKTFQAVRIKINDELDELETGLRELLRVLPRFSRIAVISFHSLEDRIVKKLFREAEKEERGHILTKRVIVPSDEEIQANPRARSAKLRGFEMSGGRA